MDLWHFPYKWLNYQNRCGLTIYLIPSAPVGMTSTKNSPAQALRNSQSIFLIRFLICFSFLKSTSCSSLLLMAPAASSILWKSIFILSPLLAIGGDLLWPPLQLLLHLALSCSLIIGVGSADSASSMDSRLLGLGWSHTTHFVVLGQFW